MIDNYLISKIIGEGPNGVVYEAECVISNKKVAIKKFKESSAKKIRSLVKREEVLKNLSHPNIIQIIDSFDKNDEHYIVYELGERSLRDLLDDYSKGLSESAAKKFIYQILLAVEYLHENGFVHRDIQPENIILSSSGEINLTGFSQLELIDNQDMSFVYGFSNYLAPEIITWKKSYQGEVDYWSIGCIFGELLSGKKIFSGKKEEDVLASINSLVGPLTSNILRNSRFIIDTNISRSSKESLKDKFEAFLSPEGRNLLAELCNLKVSVRAPKSNCKYSNRDYFFDTRKILSKRKTAESKTLLTKVKLESAEINSRISDYSSSNLLPKVSLFKGSLNTSFSSKQKDEYANKYGKLESSNRQTLDIMDNNLEDESKKEFLDIIKKYAITDSNLSLESHRNDVKISTMQVNNRGIISKIGYGDKLANLEKIIKVRKLNSLKSFKGIANMIVGVNYETPEKDLRPIKTQFNLSGINKDMFNEMKVIKSNEGKSDIYKRYGSLNSQSTKSLPKKKYIVSSS